MNLFLLLTLINPNHHILTYWTRPLFFTLMKKWSAPLLNPNIRMRLLEADQFLFLNQMIIWKSDLKKVKQIWWEISSTTKKVPFMMLKKVNVQKVERNFFMLFNLYLSKMYSEEEAPDLLHMKKHLKDKKNIKIELKKDKIQKKTNIKTWKWLKTRNHP